MIDNPPSVSRYWSEAECRSLFERIQRLSRGEGQLFVGMESRWRGHLRWARNEVTNAGDVREPTITIGRKFQGAFGQAVTNSTDDMSLRVALAQAAEQASYARESEIWALMPRRRTPEYARPKLFFHSTYTLSPSVRARLTEQLMQPVAVSRHVAAGYLELQAMSRAVIDDSGFFCYHTATTAEYSVTVRDPKGNGSGWAGVDGNDWARIDPAKISRRALDKCQQSANPQRLEPGRYTVILEPQAVHDVLQFAVDPLGDRLWAETDRLPRSPYFRTKGSVRALQRVYDLGHSKLGLKVLDERLSIMSDPMDADAGFLPFDMAGEAYRKTSWITNGILTTLAYDRQYALTVLGQAEPLPLSGAYRVQVTGPTASVDEMIRTTTRGLLVTRFSEVQQLDIQSVLLSGYTRDGLWLIENGRVKTPMKNFRFVDSPLFAFNNVEQIGTPVRVYSPGRPAIVPAIKVRDFNMVALADAV